MEISNNLFREKYLKKEYISRYLDKATDNKVKPEDFNLEKYNATVLAKDYHKYKLYFDTIYSGIDEAKIEAMSIHKSKGLTYDEVIIMGLDRDFPINGRSNFWLENLFSPKDDEETFRDAEERRVFYVALTRTKNHVFLLVNNDSSLRSPFIEELYQIIKKDL